MSTEKMPVSGKKLLLGAIIAFVALGGSMAYLGSESTSILSQFSGTNVIPSTASNLWQPTTSNPYRPFVSNYASRIDSLVIHILARGSDLPSSRYKTYLDTLVTRFEEMRKSPEYANNAEISSIIKYLNFELTDSAKTFSASSQSFERMMDIVNTTATEMSGTGGTVEPTLPDCPIYGIASPSEWCSYTTVKNSNGCDMPKLVCTNTGSTATGTIAPDTVNLVGCKLLKKSEKTFEGDNGYTVEGQPAFSLTDHLAHFENEDMGTYLSVPHNTRVTALKTVGKEAYTNTFVCNNGTFKRWLDREDEAYGPLFCNLPWYTIDGFTVKKMLQKSGPGDMNGGYQYFYDVVWNTFRTGYAKCDGDGTIIIKDKKEYPVSWNCKRGEKVDGITIPAGLKFSYIESRYTDDYFLNGYIDTYSQKTMSDDGTAYNIKIKCDKGKVIITEKVLAP